MFYQQYFLLDEFQVSLVLLDCIQALLQVTLSHLSLLCGFELMSMRVICEFLSKTLRLKVFINLAMV